MLIATVSFTNIDGYRKAFSADFDDDGNIGDVSFEGDLVHLMQI